MTKTELLKAIDRSIKRSKERESRLRVEVAVAKRKGELEKMSSYIARVTEVWVARGDLIATRKCLASMEG